MPSPSALEVAYSQPLPPVQPDSSDPTRHLDFISTASCPANSNLRMLAGHADSSGAPREPREQPADLRHWGPFEKPPYRDEDEESGAGPTAAGYWYWWDQEKMARDWEEMSDDALPEGLRGVRSPSQLGASPRPDVDDSRWNILHPDNGRSLTLDARRRRQEERSPLRSHSGSPHQDEDARRSAPAELASSLHEDAPGYSQTQLGPTQPPVKHRWNIFPDFPEGAELRVRKEECPPRRQPEGAPLELESQSLSPEHDAPGYSQTELGPTQPPVKHHWNIFPDFPEGAELRVREEECQPRRQPEGAPVELESQSLSPEYDAPGYSQTQLGPTQPPVKHRWNIFPDFPEGDELRVGEERLRRRGSTSLSPTPAGRRRRCARLSLAAS